MNAPTPRKRDVSLHFGGPPITTLWAWVVTDHRGKEAISRSPWSPTAVLMGPDEDIVASPTMEQWCRAYYEPQGIKVELRRFDLTPPA
jgi:hypothetical protein